MFWIDRFGEAFPYGPEPVRRHPHVFDKVVFNRVGPALRKFIIVSPRPRLVGMPLDQELFLILEVLIERIAKVSERLNRFRFELRRSEFESYRPEGHTRRGRNAHRTIRRSGGHTPMLDFIREGCRWHICRRHSQTRSRRRGRRRPQNRKTPGLQLTADILLAGCPGGHLRGSSVSEQRNGSARQGRQHQSGSSVHLPLSCAAPVLRSEFLPRRTYRPVYRYGGGRWRFRLASTEYLVKIKEIP